MYFSAMQLLTELEKKLDLTISDVNRMDPEFRLAAERVCNLGGLFVI